MSGSGQRYSMSLNSLARKRGVTCMNSIKVHEWFFWSDCDAELRVNDCSFTHWHNSLSVVAFVEPPQLRYLSYVVFVPLYILCAREIAFMVLMSIGASLWLGYCITRSLFNRLLRNNARFLTFKCACVQNCIHLTTIMQYNFS